MYQRKHPLALFVVQMCHVVSVDIPIFIQQKLESRNLQAWMAPLWCLLSSRRSVEGHFVSKMTQLSTDYEFVQQIECN